MIARDQPRSSTTAPNNIIALIVNHLQPQIAQPLNATVLVEAVLTQAIDQSGELHLLSWVKMLPVAYYPNLLNVVKPEAFNRWHEFMPDKEIYDELSLEQKNEWELALFQFRNKFPEVLNADAFEDILDNPYRSESILAWRLERESPLSKDALEALACLDYPAMARYVASSFPANEQLDFAIKANPDLSNPVIGQVSWVLDQYSRWVDYLPSDVDKSKFLKHVLVTYVHQMTKVEDVSVFHRLFKRLLPEDQLNVAKFYFPTYYQADRMHLNFALNCMPNSEKNVFIQALLFEMDGLFLAKFNSADIDHVLGLFPLDRRLAMLNSRDPAGVSVFELCAKSDDLLDAIFNRVPFNQYSYPLLQASPYALIASSHTDVYFEKFLNCIPVDQLAGFLMHRHINLLTGHVSPLFMCLIYQPKAFMAVIHRMPPEDARRLLMLPQSRGENLLHIAVKDNLDYPIVLLAKHLTAAAYQQCLDQRDDRQMTPLNLLRDPSRFSSIMRPIPVHEWLGYIASCASTVIQNELISDWIAKTTPSDFLRALALRQPIRSPVISRAIMKQFVDLKARNCVLDSAVFDFIRMLHVEDQYQYLHETIHGELMVHFVMRRVNQDRAAFAGIEGSPLGTYLTLRGSLENHALPASAGNAWFAYFLPAKASKPLKVLEQLNVCVSYEQARRVLDDFVEKDVQCNDALKNEVQAILAQTQPEPYIAPPPGLRRPMSTG